jgi:hypothetical protein
MGHLVRLLLVVMVFLIVLDLLIPGVDLLVPAIVKNDVLMRTVVLPNPPLDLFQLLGNDLAVLGRVVAVVEIQIVGRMINALKAFILVMKWSHPLTILKTKKLP